MTDKFNDYTPSTRPSSSQNSAIEKKQNDRDKCLKKSESRCRDRYTEGRFLDSCLERARTNCAEFVPKPNPEPEQEPQPEGIRSVKDTAIRLDAILDLKNNLSVECFIPKELKNRLSKSGVSAIPQGFGPDCTFIKDQGEADSRACMTDLYLQCMQQFFDCTASAASKALSAAVGIHQAREDSRNPILGSGLTSVTGRGNDGIAHSFAFANAPIAADCLSITECMEKKQSNREIDPGQPDDDSTIAVIEINNQATGWQPLVDSITETLETDPVNSAEKQGDCENKSAQPSEGAPDGPVTGSEDVISSITAPSYPGSGTDFSSTSSPSGLAPNRGVQKGDVESCLCTKCIYVRNQTTTDTIADNGSGFVNTTFTRESERTISESGSEQLNLNPVSSAKELPVESESQVEESKSTTAPSVFGEAWVPVKIIEIDESSLSGCTSSNKKISGKYRLTSNKIASVTAITRNGVLIDDIEENLDFSLQYTNDGATDIIITNVPISWFGDDNELDLKFRVVERYLDGSQIYIPTVLGETGVFYDSDRFFHHGYNEETYLVDNNNDVIKFSDFTEKTDTGVNIGNSLLSVSPFSDLIYSESDTVNIHNQNTQKTLTFSTATSDKNIHHLSTWSGWFQMDHLFPYHYNYKRRNPVLELDTWIPHYNSTTRQSSYYLHYPEQLGDCVTVPSHVADFDLSHQQEHYKNSIPFNYSRLLWSKTSSLDGTDIFTWLESSNSVISLEALPGSYNSDSVTIADETRNLDGLGDYGTPSYRPKIRASLGVYLSVDNTSVYVTDKYRRAAFYVHPGKLFIFDFYPEQVSDLSLTNPLFTLDIPISCTNKMEFSPYSDSPFISYLSLNKEIVTVNLIDGSFSITGIVSDSDIDTHGFGNTQFCISSSTRPVLVYSTSNGIIKRLEPNNPYAGSAGFNLTQAVARMMTHFEVDFQVINSDVLSTDIAGFTVPDYESLPTSLKNLSIVSGLKTSASDGSGTVIITSNSEPPYTLAKVQSYDQSSKTILQSLGFTYTDYLSGDRGFYSSDDSSSVLNTNLTVISTKSASKIHNNITHQEGVDSLFIPLNDYQSLSHMSSDSYDLSVDGIKISQQSYSSNSTQNSESKLPINNVNPNANTDRPVIIRGEVIEDINDVNYGYLHNGDFVSVNGLPESGTTIFNTRTHEYRNADSFVLKSASTYELFNERKCYFNSEYSQIGLNLTGQNPDDGLWVFLDENRLSYSSPTNQLNDYILGEQYLRNVYYPASKSRVYSNGLGPSYIRINNKAVEWVSSGVGGTGKFLLVYWWGPRRDVTDALAAMETVNRTNDPDSFNSEAGNREIYTDIVTNTIAEFPENYEYPLTRVGDFVTKVNADIGTSYKGNKISTGWWEIDKITSTAKSLVSNTDIAPIFGGLNVITNETHRDWFYRTAIPGYDQWTYTYDGIEEQLRLVNKAQFPKLTTLNDYWGQKEFYTPVTLIAWGLGNEIILPSPLPGFDFPEGILPIRFIFHVLLYPEHNKYQSISSLPPQGTQDYSTVSPYWTDLDPSDVNQPLMDAVEITQKLLDHFYFDRLFDTTDQVRFEEHGLAPPFTLRHNDASGDKITKFFTDAVEAYWPYNRLNVGDTVNLLIAEYQEDGGLSHPTVVENHVIEDVKDSRINTQHKLRNRSSQIYTMFYQPSLAIEQMSLTYLVPPYTPPEFKMEQRSETVYTLLEARSQYQYSSGLYSLLEEDRMSNTSSSSFAVIST